MIKQYFQQAWAQLRQQPLISGVTVAGTALSIFLIMLVVMMQQVQVEPFAPESNRDRFLHVKWGSITNEAWGDSNSNGPWSATTLKEIYGKLKTPEAVTVYVVYSLPQPVSLPGQPTTAVDVRETDSQFWTVFDFAFTDGKPFDQATFDAGRPVAVITESVARLLFGTTKAVGKEFLLAHAPYRVCGVVKDVSTLAETAYAQVWIPYTSTDQVNNTWEHDLMGLMSCTILARDRSDFPAIREEAARRLDEFNKVIGENGYKIINRNRPYDQEKNALVAGANVEPDVTAARRTRFIIFLILLIVPAINLSSMTQSRLRRRVAEIGGAPCLRLHTHGTAGADTGRELHRHPAGRCAGADNQPALCLPAGRYPLCAELEHYAQSARGRCLHPDTCLHLRLGVALLLRAQPAQYRYSRLAGVADEYCGGD